MIELKEVTKEYSKGIAALNGINLRIEQGEFVFVVGDSGSGKSTLIRLLMKEIEPTSGTIIVNGQNLNRMKHRQIPQYRRGIGVVFQDFRLLKDRNIYENIAFALRVTETPSKVIKKKVQKNQPVSSKRKCRRLCHLSDWHRSTKRSRRNCPVGNSRELQLPEQLSMSLLFCWLMSRQETWIQPTHGRS